MKLATVLALRACIHRLNAVCSDSLTLNFHQILENKTQEPFHFEFFVIFLANFHPIHEFSDPLEVSTSAADDSTNMDASLPDSTAAPDLGMQTT